MSTQEKNIIIVGGGLAGIAAAVALGQRGAKVTLLESRHALGGRSNLPIAIGAQTYGRSRSVSVS